MSEPAAIQGYLTRSAQATLPSIRGNRNGEVTRDHSDFASLLNRSSRVASRPEHAQEDMLKEAAGQLVADAFILPLLETMHDSPLRPTSGPFAAGTAEKRFMPLLDQQFADRITQSNHFPLVDSVVKHLSKVSGQQSGGVDASA